MKPLRYPGTKPFEQGQELLFFGREQEETDLFRRVQLDAITVLHGSSGVGKSSLINAGLIPKLTNQTNYRSIRFRLLSEQDTQQTPNVVARIRTTLKQQFPNPEQPSFLHQLVAEDDSVWAQLKRIQISRPAEAVPPVLLIFDQAEQLLNIKEGPLRNFKREFAEALSAHLPDRYIKALESQGRASLSDAQLDLLQSPPNLRLLFSIRSDRIHLLDRISDFLPGVRRNRKELRALGRDQARRAIVTPAQLEGDFRSPPFNYHPEALQAILDYLTKEDELGVAGTQLQILCSRFEERILHDSNKLEILSTDVADIEEMIRSYYEERISAIPSEAQQLQARNFIEERLILDVEERSMPLYEGAVKHDFGLTTETLALLVAGHLIRTEIDPKGGFVYELSHDTLIEPILRAKADRVKAEAAAKLAQQQAELTKELKRRRRIILLLSSLLVLLLLLVLSLWMILNTRSQLARVSIQSNLDIAKQLRIQAFYTEAHQQYTNTLRYFGGSIPIAKQDSIRREMVLVVQLDSIVSQAERARSNDALRQAAELYRNAYELAGDSILDNRLSILSSTIAQRVETLKDQIDADLNRGRSAAALQKIEALLTLQSDPNYQVLKDSLQQVLNSQ